MTRPPETAELRNLLNGLDRVKPVGSGWQACCPVHDDDDPSLSAGIGNNGAVILNCHVGCKPEAILEAVGLRWSDLWPERNQTVPERPKRKVNETAYEAIDQGGVHWATHRRIDFDDGSKKLWWERPDGSNGLGGLRPDDLPLYRVQLLMYEQSAVFVVEGQKAADKLAELGVEVVATYGANHKPSDDTLRPLLPYDRVCLWPDPDRPGQAHGSDLASRLTDLGHQDISIIEWPDAGETDDAYDFVKAGNGRSELAELVTLARRWEPPKVDEDKDTFSVNGLSLRFENVDLRDGLRTTVIAMNGVKSPVALDRGNLDSEKFRESLANTLKLDPVDLLRFRDHVHRRVVNPTANQPHTSLLSLRDQSVAHGERSRDAYIRTGLTKLDDRIGGFLPGQLIVASAPTGGGKTSLMASVALDNAQTRQICCGIISLEMSGRELFDRLVSLVASVNVAAFNRSDSQRPEIRQRVDRGRQAVTDLPIHIEDNVAATLPAVIEHARRMKADLDIDILFIDQVHSIRTNMSEHRTELVGQIANAFKQLARELQIPIVTGAQQNRDAKYRKEKTPILDDIRDSAEIGHQADLVLFIHHPAMYDVSRAEDIAEIFVAKNRDGATGDPIKVRWKSSLMKFSNLG